MRKLFTCSVAVMAFACANVTFAGGPEFGGPILVQGPTPPQAPAYQPSIEPIPAQGTPIILLPAGSGPAVGLYQNVKYKGTRNIAPCAVPMVVSVKDPCACTDPCNACAPPQCVNVQICVPQCECPPRVTTARDGHKTRYDFGKFAVNITSRRGLVVVDYDD